MSKYKNDVKRSLGALVGIAQGLVCDGHLNDQEIGFLNQWLTANDEICVEWPGDIIHQRVKGVLADGVITDSERAYLIETLQGLIGGTAETLAASSHVTDFAFDEVPICEFPGMRFCLTGRPGSTLPDYRIHRTEMQSGKEAKFRPMYTADFRMGLYTTASAPLWVYTADSFFCASGRSGRGIFCVRGSRLSL